MKYCSKCGKELSDNESVCPKCGCVTQTVAKSGAMSGGVVKELTAMQKAAKIFMIISCVLWGLSIIPLLWCIPMTKSYVKKIESGEAISTTFKICTLLFMSVVSGILMLCDKE